MKENKYIKLSCGYCLKNFNRYKGEHNRQIKKGKLIFFCSLSCSCYYTQKKKFGSFNLEIIKTCLFCNNNFFSREPGAKYCSHKCANAITNSRFRSKNEREKTSHALKEWIKNNPEKDAEIRDKISKTLNTKSRRSSKSERTLGAELEPFGFKRHKFIRSGYELNFDVDIWLETEKGMIWVESDGPYHFRKVHKHHDFEKSKRRDEIESLYIKDRNILLIRVNNEKYTINEQVNFVKEKMNNWNGNSKIEYLY